MSVYIVSAARTPIGNFNGTLAKTPAAELGTVVIKEVLKRSNTNAEDVNEVILGQALTAGAGQNPARQAAWNAGLPKEVPAFCLNMLCGSGLKSVYLGYQSIKSGESSVVVAGGQENMSLAPHATQLRSGIKYGSATFIDTILYDGLTDFFTNIPMGNTAENVAKKYNVSRAEQDAFAAQSQQLAEVAWSNGYFDNEIVPVTIPGRSGDTIFAKDEFPKAGTTVEGLSKLRAHFEKGGSVTAGNASGINDSAAAVLLMSADEVKKRGVQPLAKIIAFAQGGCEPDIMGIGMVPSVQTVLKKSRLGQGRS